ncbi:hypothetical protein F2Q69_00047011 [Brassica cretica]|uniref:Uncharacterized protein n=1 Tax=Brassica cretica TaxID=69181 RepID=A0A8S9Q541_BRACR|nr:hypothetical protein F2Q69_00047011 [Brassica cretica]
MHRNTSCLAVPPRAPHVYLHVQVACTAATPASLDTHTARSLPPRPEHTHQATSSISVNSTDFGLFGLVAEIAMSGNIPSRVAIHLQEADAWKMAQIVDMTFTAEENDQTEALVPATTTATSRCRCQVDASWSETSDGIGMGFVLVEQEVEVLRGQCKGPQT